ncbi:hypothetical protein [Roseivivax isoporae]|uniref:Uncharacterized protein n=1 Tax=Roseivivax isoporae LMG 25204 TaxID=1449351 RepID=X7F8D4_9RHOB|nr:hypothetical protein [Roseivivax isoporae]ETX29025.1 hypothetical protein RISW2_03530 [Roseivivax isoporae LMG 25204]
MKTPNTPPGAAMRDETEKLHDQMDAALARQLQRIENEETPEHLLALARELQELLRGKS